mmetsp:Transcript_42498/g.88895  ORF Transcript_42498/g.88895 Transcript_42498/m.88895 type:complete len:82 (+) Transcript_42498:214-459(+)
MVKFCRNTNNQSENLVLCELESIRLAGTEVPTCAADSLHREATLPSGAAISSRADLQAPFSTLDQGGETLSRASRQTRHQL